ncbi:hypothetical protein OAA21_00640 [bacterium]|nr:hypothetical protein [bacterium]
MSRARDTADQINRVNSSAADATAITVDSSEKVGVGTSSPTSKLSVESSLADNNTALIKNTSGTGVNYGLEIAAGTNATDHALHVTSSTGTSLLRVNGAGNVGIGTSTPSSNYGFSKTVEIQGGVNAELSLSQTNNSKDWSFGVGNGDCYQQTNSGQNYSWYTGGVEKLRIQSGGGISFNGDTAAANALDDYEEGTWTPSLGGNATYNFQSGFYTKVGRQVTLVFYLDVSSIGTGSTSTITGQPFASTTFAPGSGVISRLTTSNGSYVSASGQIGSSNIVIVGKTSASANTANISPFQNGTGMYMTITYFTS